MVLLVVMEDQEEDQVQIANTEHLMVVLVQVTVIWALAAMVLVAQYVLFGDQAEHSLLHQLLICNLKNASDNRFIDINWC